MGVLKFPVLTVLLLFTLSMDMLSTHYIITLALLVDVVSLLSSLSLHSRSTEVRLSYTLFYCDTDPCSLF